MGMGIVNTPSNTPDNNTTYTISVVEGTLALVGSDGKAIPIPLANAEQNGLMSAGDKKVIADLQNSMGGISWVCEDGQLYAVYDDGEEGT